METLTLVARDTSRPTDNACGVTIKRTIYNRIQELHDIPAYGDHRQSSCRKHA